MFLPLLLTLGLIAAEVDVPVEGNDCGAPKRLHGIDVSKYQGQIDWPRVAASGISFAFARISDGTTAVDETFARNYAAMKQVHVRRGAYQYFRASVDAKAQADLFLKTLRHNGRPDLPSVLDIETDDGQPAAVVQKQVKKWLRRVEKKSGMRPMIYTNPSVAATLLAGMRLERYKLWIAHYEVECPTEPAQWKRWTFWQHSSHGRVDGIVSDVDLDEFAGSVRDLKRLKRRAK
ncbi:MAG: putative rane protein [Myxococcales bacterium]|nr:putative rane protein [Myxococcales bacterium]